MKLQIGDWPFVKTKISCTWLIDLFDFDPKNNRAGVGIVIQKSNNRIQNIGSEALELLIEYAFFNLNFIPLYANIGTENVASTALLLNLDLKWLV
jgi:diamine N-acetyltransferase